MLNTVLNGACASGKFPSWDRLGRIYRCGNYGTQQSGPSDCIYLMGRSGTDEEARMLE